MQNVVCLEDSGQTSLPTVPKSHSPDQQSSHKTSPHIASHGVVPTEFGDQSRKDESREKGDTDVVLVLEHDDWK
jgi:hypothetical protein